MAPATVIQNPTLKSLLGQIQTIARVAHSIVSCRSVRHEETLDPFVGHLAPCTPPALRKPGGENASDEAPPTSGSFPEIGVAICGAPATSFLMMLGVDGWLIGVPRDGQPPLPIRRILLSEGPPISPSRTSPMWLRPRLAPIRNIVAPEVYSLRPKKARGEARARSGTSTPNPSERLLRPLATQERAIVTGERTPETGFG